MKIRVLLNPISGRGRQPQDDISNLRHFFAEQGVSAQVISLQSRGQATQLAREAVAENFDMVVAVGGDGTINETVCGLVNSDVPLGIIPAGSGNGLARTFCIPLDIKGACRTLLQGQTRSLDVGKLNDRFFLGVAGIGYDALVSRLFEEKWGGRRGLLPYLHTAVLGFFRYRVTPIH
ncbi:diacylglycerol/lipid kinase family protein, partial [Candidatus Zixiibacteriota bacterium]